MSRLLKAFKVLILKQDKGTISKLIPYYETLNQIKDTIEFIEMEAAFDGTCSGLNYVEEDEDSYYEEGHLEFYNEENGTDYTIQLSLGGMTGNYCTCVPADRDYNYNHTCCGMFCDHYPHEISITKTEKLIHHRFDGYAKDLWELESNWLENAEREKLEGQRQHRIYEVEKQIEDLHIELEKLKNT